MKLPGWLSAAIDVLETMESRHLPAKHALSDWGRAHRFAGSKDRAAIGNLVFDVERQRASLAAFMGDETPRSLILAAAVHLWGQEPASLTAAFEGDKHAPTPLTENETKRLSNPFEETLKAAPLWARANIPEWLAPDLAAIFGESLLEEGRAMACRAPVDIRVNTLKTTKEKLIKALARLQPEDTPFATTGLRIKQPEGGAKAPNLEAEAAHGKGWFEIQDAGSQLVSLLTGAKAGDQLLDYCAGAGGKTLSLSAMMENRGQIHSYDADKTRLRPIFERLRRAGCRNVQTHDAGDKAALAPLKGMMDIVLVDAPCTGTGTWRRHPDAKWRLSETALAERLREQKDVLLEAKDFVKPGGRLIYITCSLLPAENESQIKSFLADHAEFHALPYKACAAKEAADFGNLLSANGDETFLTLSPAKHGTDGFFFAVLEKR